MRPTRPISWIKSARKDFESFPSEAQSILFCALTVASEGVKAEIAKPLAGLGSRLLELALPFRGNAFPIVSALQLSDNLWGIHAFQKKLTQGIKTPQHEIDLVRERIKRLKEMLDENRNHGNRTRQRKCVS